jgi:predicted ATPase
MLTELRLQNFRGFDDHRIGFRQLSVVVGANNAGKSTIVEALRFVSIVTNRYRGLQFRRPHQQFEDAGAQSGVSPSLRNMAVTFDHVFHRYGSPPAIITASFADGSSVQVFLGADEALFACIRDQRGSIIRSQTAARTVDIPRISIMPQIGPLRREEEELSEDYVIGAASSSLSSLHFRNHFKVFQNLWDQVQEAVHQTWPGVHLQEMITSGDFPPRRLFLEVRNDDFVAEVGLMGHGLQMWLQTLAFLCRSAGSGTVILDEPDVYMHADMQRRLVRYLRGRFEQIILTTHSVEIMSEVDSSEILVVDRRRAESHFSSSAPAVQRIVERIGSAHNLQLARLWSSRRLILVEGKDVSLLKVIQNILFPRSDSPIDTVPNMPVGGWGGWSYAVGSNMLMTNAVGEEILTYCIFDRDYHSEEDIPRRQEEAAQHGVSLHIWTRKEIENFAVDGGLICRFIEGRISARTSPPAAEEIESRIEMFANEFEDSTFDAFSAEFLKHDRAGGSPKANRSARTIIKNCREQNGSIRDLVSGKQLLSRLSEWTNGEFGVSYSAHALLKTMSVGDVPAELASVVEAIERQRPFNVNR